MHPVQFNMNIPFPILTYLFGGLFILIQYIIYHFKFYLFPFSGGIGHIPYLLDTVLPPISSFIVSVNLLYHPH